MLHYVPMAMLVLTAFLYSCGTVLFYPCEEAFDYTLQICGGSCYQFQPFMGIFDTVFTVYAPIGLITLFTGALIIRVLYHKRKMQQKNRWKKNLRMLTQLLSIVILHFAVWIPPCIIFTISAVAVSLPELQPITEYLGVLILFIYIGVLGSPFTSLFALPEVNEKASEVMRRLRGRPNGNRVQAVSTNTRQLNVGNTH